MPTSTRFADLDLAGYRLPLEVASRIFTPALIVYLDHVRENLRRVLQAMGGDAERWRPHVKTTKIPEVFAEVAAAGVRNFKCATTREAQYLLRLFDERGITNGDILLAHPAIGPALDRLDDLAATHPAGALSVLCEDVAAVDRIPERLGIFIDLNPGMNRTGLAMDRPDTLIEIARRAGRRFRGLHCYDGHLHGAAEERTREAQAVYERLIDLVSRLRGQGLDVAEIVTSGTPTFLQALAFAPLSELPETLHRVSPGTVVYHDLRSEQELEDVDLVPAAVVISRIVSHPAPDIVTCDAGSKAIAAEAGDPVAYALGYPGLRGLEPSEEHLPLHVDSGPIPDRGTPLLLVPRHVCPTVNLAEEAILVEDGVIQRVVPVSARAHEAQDPSIRGDAVRPD